MLLQYHRYQVYPAGSAAASGIPQTILLPIIHSPVPKCSFPRSFPKPRQMQPVAKRLSTFLNPLAGLPSGLPATGSQRGAERQLIAGSLRVDRKRLPT